MELKIEYIPVEKLKATATNSSMCFASIREKEKNI